MARARAPEPSIARGPLVGELAASLGVTPKTLRHYEKLGVMPPPGRGPNGYRVYPEASVQRARLAVRLRALGFSLAVVRELLSAPDGPRMRARLTAVLDQRVHEAMLQIAVLQGQHEEIEARLLAVFRLPADAGTDTVCRAFLGGADPAAEVRTVRTRSLTLP